MSLALASMGFACSPVHVQYFILHTLNISSILARMSTGMVGILAKQVQHSYRYMDDLLSINNK